MTTPAQSLIMPMDMHLLCVGSQDTDTRALGPTYRFQTMAATRTTHALRQPNVTEKILEHGKPFVEGEPLGLGVHLHWTLPAPLRHAAEAPPPPVKTATPEPRSAVSDFPAVPNRWLVTRFIFQPDGAPRMRRWVVESDWLQSAPGRQWGWRHPSVPVELGTENQRSLYIGRQFDADDWKESGGANRFSPLTALGYGDPRFAAFYLNCSTVFGFYDDLSDLPASQPAKLGYHVVGWFGGGVQDFLATDEGVRAMLRFGKTTAPAAIPAHLLCNSALHEVDWQPGSRYLDVSSSALACAVGPSPSEALSVMLAAASGDAQLEGGLNALQHGEMEKLGERLDAADRFSERLHEAGFKSNAGGSIWVLTTPEKNGPEMPAPLPVPEQLLQHVIRLSTNQQQLDRRRGRLATARRQLFANWYKFQLARYDFSVPDKVRDWMIVPLLLKQTASIESQVVMIARQEYRLSRCIELISQRIPAGHALESQPAPRFWSSRNPSLVLMGQDTKASPASTPSHVPITLTPWRTDRQIVRRFAIEKEGPQLGLSDWPGLGQRSCPGLPSALADTIQALSSEAGLFAAAHRPAVVTHLVQRIGGTTKSDAAALFGHLVDAFLSGQTLHELFGEALPPRAPQYLEAGRAPWLPIQIQYEVALTYAAGLAPQPYCGTGMLSQHGTVQLDDAIKAVLDRDGNAPGLAGLKKWLDTLPLATQSMSGLNAMLTQMNPSGQLPVADPFILGPAAKDPFDQAMVLRIREAVAHENWFAPLPDKPLISSREGTLKVQRVRIVDSFGRFRDHSPHSEPPLSILTARNLRENIEAADNTIARLPYRMTQPARLHFRWSSAWSGYSHPTDNPPASPVIGWVLLDNVDGGLSIFDADANAIGTLMNTAGQDSRLLWRTAAPDIGLRHPNSSLLKVHPELRSFVMTLYSGTVERFLTFRELLREALKGIQPSSAVADDAWSQLVGRPLALVCATLAIELKGGATPDISWKMLDGSKASEPKPHPIPVSLGASGRLGDGLIAYWKRMEFKFRFRRKPTASVDDATILVQPDSEDLMQITMLIDPRAAVHATCDALPVKAINLPAQHYSSMLNRLDVMLRAGPLLTMEGTVPAPAVPAHSQDEWAWYGPNGACHPLDIEAVAEVPVSLSRQEIVEGWLGLHTPEPAKAISRK